MRFLSVVFVIFAILFYAFAENRIATESNNNESCDIHSNTETEIASKVLHLVENLEKLSLWLDEIQREQKINGDAKVIDDDRLVEMLLFAAKAEKDARKLDECIKSGDFLQYMNRMKIRIGPMDKWLTAVNKLCKLKWNFENQWCKLLQRSHFSMAM